MSPKFTLQLGSAGATPIIADLHDKGAGAHPWDVVRVQLSATYTPIQPPGYPEVPPAGAAVAAQRRRAGGAISSGTTLSLYAHEASALVSAGKASYV